MSGPFVYVPSADSYPTPFGVPYPTSQRSPFIPAIPIQGSPWTPVSSLPGTPNRPSATLPAAPDGYIPAYIPVHTRRPSWNGTPPSPFHPASLEVPPLGRPRSNSHGATTYVPFQNPAPMWPGVNPWFYPANQMYVVNPWLNGEAPRSDFLFNLSYPNFAPMRFLGMGQQVALGWEELSQPATHPPITRLEIVCDLIPEWPIVLDAGAQAQPIRLYDVLLVVHRSLHSQITQDDWKRLSDEAQRRVAKAYERRCALLPQLELVQKSQGVKRVDFLRKKIWFRGLVRMPQGINVMKMIVA
ncbi:hypothetical protein AX16_007906 [Volvariella volvacea WC 439]|nr:hypothetical protein AX16_007906 [Volvariella volvacea WC 439]